MEDANIIGASGEKIGEVVEILIDEASKTAAAVIDVQQQGATRKSPTWND
ncbi:MAG: hypothetical protein GYB27_03405 [Rhodobacteraceae bacterium]|nr:hypothetical protein [Paracoccaceae bacterium]